MNILKEKVLNIKGDITILRQKRNIVFSNISCDEINEVIQKISACFNDINSKYRQIIRDYENVSRPSNDLKIMDLATNTIVINILQNLKNDFLIYLCNILSPKDLQDAEKWLTNFKDEFLNDEKAKFISVDNNIAQPVALEKYDDFRVTGPDFFKDVRNLIALLTEKYNILVKECKGKSNKNISKNKLLNGQTDIIFSTLDKLCDLLIEKIEILQERKEEISRYNSDVNRYNELVAKCKKNNTNNLQFYSGWRRKIENNSFYKCVTNFKVYKEIVTSIKQMLNLIKEKLIADKEIILSFEKELDMIVKKYNSSISTLIRLFETNPECKFHEKINKIITDSGIIESFKSSRVLWGKVKKYQDSLNEKEMLLNKLSSIDELLTKQNVSNSIARNVSLSESQRNCMTYLTEQFQNVYIACFNLYANGSVFDVGQTDDEKYKKYIEFAKIEGSFIGVLAVFIEFISYSRVNRYKNDVAFDRNNLQHNNNVEINYLKELLPKLFYDLKFNEIYNGKGFLRYVVSSNNYSDNIGYNNEFAVEFIYQFINNFTNGVRVLLDERQVFLRELGRIGNIFDKYYVNKLENLKENRTNIDRKIISEYRKAALQRMYMTFVNCREYIGIKDDYDDDDYSRKLYGPSWERNLALGDSKDNYPYFSNACLLPPDISYSEINIYILKIYRMLYEVEKRFVEPLCPNEFVDNFIKGLPRGGNKK